MRRAVILLEGAVLLLGLACSNLAVAQEEDAGTSDKAADPRQEATTPEGDPSDEQATERPKRTRRPRFEPTIAGRNSRHYVRRLERLQEAMKRDLSLRREQEETIDALFKENRRTLEVRPGRREPTFTPEQRAEMKVLREKIIKARKEADRAALEELREQLRSRLQGVRPKELMSPDQFVQRLESELDRRQVRKFRKLTQRFRIGSYATRPVAQLRRLAQAVRRPEVALSTDKRRSVLKIVRDAQTKLDEIEDDDEKQANQIVDEARAGVFEQLTPKQRQRVENALATAEASEGIRRGPDRRHRRPTGKEVEHTEPQSADDRGGESEHEDDSDDDGD